MGPLGFCLFCCCCCCCTNAFYEYCCLCVTAQPWLMMMWKNEQSFRCIQDYCHTADKIRMCDVRVHQSIQSSKYCALNLICREIIEWSVARMNIENKRLRGMQHQQQPPPNASWLYLLACGTTLMIDEITISVNVWWFCARSHQSTGCHTEWLDCHTICAMCSRPILWRMPHFTRITMFNVIFAFG